MLRNTIRNVGYIRPILGGPSVRLQQRHLFDVHPDNLHVERKNAEGYPKLELARMDARKGDTFIVYTALAIPTLVMWRTLIEDFHARGIGFVAIQQGIDARSKDSMREMLQAFEQDRYAKGLRIRQGQALSANRPGRPCVDETLLKRAEALIRAGSTLTEVAALVGVSRRTLYNAGLGRKKE